MPKLWTDTIEAHRREVRDAILDTAAALVDERGLLAVTMSQIAEVAERPGRARDRLEAVLEAFALIAHGARGGHGSALASFLHRDEQLGHAEHRLQALIGDLLAEGAPDGGVR